VEQSSVDIDPFGSAEVTLWLRVPTVDTFEAAPVVFVDDGGARGIPVILRGRGVDPPVRD
jgi:hypothetical protein